MVPHSRLLSHLTISQSHLGNVVNASNPAFDATSLRSAWKNPSRSSTGMLLTSSKRIYHKGVLKTACQYRAFAIPATLVNI